MIRSWAKTRHANALLENSTDNRPQTLVYYKRPFPIPLINRGNRLCVEPFKNRRALAVNGRDRGLCPPLARTPCGKLILLLCALQLQSRVMSFNQTRRKTNVVGTGKKNLESFLENNRTVRRARRSRKTIHNT